MKPHIVIASDHAGYRMKEHIVSSLADAGYSIENLGPFSESSVDYTDYAHAVALEISDHAEQAVVGVLLCGSGNGVSIAANKHDKIRAGLCWTPEIAQLARAHNDANVLCIPARFVSDSVGLDIVTRFLSTDFEGGRHAIRVGKIDPMSIDSEDSDEVI